MSSLNESDKSTHLELLPAELKCQILTNIPNMKALRAFLSASPRYFQVYRTCREVVLSHVAWNHITPTVVPMALDALDRRDKRKNGLCCFEQYTRKRTLKQPHEIPLETWETLLRFHRIVDSLIFNFTSSRLVALENAIILPQSQTSSSDESPGRHLNLSQLEYARLARAFYHLELYTYGIYPSDLPVPQMLTMMQAKTFLQSLQGWELEELLCVRSYMIERLIDFLNKFAEDFMKAYLKDKPCIRWPSQNGLELNWRAHLFVYGDNIQSEWIESSLVRGLEYLWAILSKDKLPDKFNALQFTYLEYQWISTVLNELQPYSEEEVTAKMKESSELGFYDNIEQPNEAWIWAIKFCGLPRICSKKEPLIKPVQDGCDTNDFERWGYVIWDHARLERLGILTKSPSDISTIIGTDWVIKKTPKSLEERTWEYEEAWLHAGLQPDTTRPIPVFDWEQIWFE